MYTGKLILNDKQGNPVKVLAYNSKTHIKTIKENWKKQYGPKYSEEQVIDTPDFEPSAAIAKEKYSKPKERKLVIGSGSGVGRMNGRRCHNYVFN